MRPTELVVAGAVGIASVISLLEGDIKFGIIGLAILISMIASLKYRKEES